MRDIYALVQYVLPTYYLTSIHVIQDRKGYSTLYHAMAQSCVQLGKVLLQHGCWMRGPALKEFVADMSLGREPFRIILDSRSIEECRALYLAPSSLSTSSIEANAAAVVAMSSTSPRNSKPSKGNQQTESNIVIRNSAANGSESIPASTSSREAYEDAKPSGISAWTSTGSRRSNGSRTNGHDSSRNGKKAAADMGQESSDSDEDAHDRTHVNGHMNGHKIGNNPSVLSRATRSATAATRRGRRSLHEVDMGGLDSKRHVQRQSRRRRGSAPLEGSEGSESEGDLGGSADEDDDHSSSSGSTTFKKPRRRSGVFPGRYSNRVFAQSKVEGDSALDIETEHWKARSVGILPYDVYQV